METNIDKDYDDASLDEISEDILLGLGCNTEANQEYLFLRLEELVSHVIELCAEKAIKMKLAKKKLPPDADRDTIEL